MSWSIEMIWLLQVTLKSHVHDHGKSTQCPDHTSQSPDPHNMIVIYPEDNTKALWKTLERLCNQSPVRTWPSWCCLFPLWLRALASPWASLTSAPRPTLYFPHVLFASCSYLRASQGWFPPLHTAHSARDISVYTAMHCLSLLLTQHLSIHYSNYKHNFQTIFNFFCRTLKKTPKNTPNI